MKTDMINIFPVCMLLIHWLKVSLQKVFVLAELTEIQNRIARTAVKAYKSSHINS